MKKKHKIILPILSISSLAIILISSFFSFGSLNKNESIYQNNYQLWSVNQASSKASQYIDFYNPGSDFQGDLTLKNKVINIFNKKPSQIEQFDIDTLLIFIDPSIIQLGFSNSPKFVNLNKQTNPSLPDSTPLDVYSSTTSSTNVFSTTYLDKIGVLGFKLTLTNNAGVTYHQYFLMSGFNSQIIRTSLPGSEYQYTVNEIPDSKLLTFVNFASSSVVPSLYLVPDSRKNNEASGTISFDLNFLYNIPGNLNFNLSILNSRFNDPIPPSSSNIFSLQTSYNQNFSYTGFQTGNALSNNQIYGIVGIVAGSIVGLIIIIAFFTFIIKKIRFRNQD